MGWFTNNDDAAKAGEADAKADVKAGGFGKGGQPSGHCKNDEQTKAYDKSYVKNAPRSWGGKK